MITDAPTLVPRQREDERWVEREDEDALFRQLRLTVRQSLAAEDAATPAATLDPATAWQRLTDVGAWEFALPIDVDGLDLGQAVLAMVCEETGAARGAVPLLGTLTACELLTASPAGAGRDTALLDGIRSGEIAIAVPGRLPGPDGTAPTGLVRTVRRGTSTVSGIAGPFSVGVTPGALLLFLNTGPDTGSGATAAGPEPCVALLPLPAEGVTLRSLTDHGGGPCATAEFADAPLPSPRVLLEGEAARTALRRIGPRVAVQQAALLTGLTAAALTAVVSRIRERRQFGQPLIKHQAPRLRVAGLLARLDAVRWAVGDAARDLDAGRLTPGEAAGLTALAAETALDVTRDAVHLHGASGLARDAVVAGCYRRVAWEALRCGRPTALWQTVARTP
ncbi:acyl-CoA dehydrogenase family protein [Streptomyces sp. NPDC001339]|uniref:acyl-CoA dehydrogenase family protein n=1 Tax=Streptomyces sp. NPDC001339 TaxID=3364563 RepID=UPI0036A2B06A